MQRRINFQKTHHHLQGPPPPPQRSISGPGVRLLQLWKQPPSNTTTTTTTGSHRHRRPYNKIILMVFGILMTLVLTLIAYSGVQNNKTSPSTFGNTTTATIVTISDVQNEFYQRYGGQEQATRIYERGIRSFGALEHTAQRFLRILASSTSSKSVKSFVFSFAGYSVTVGRGNHYEQSYPFVLERILQPLLLSELNIQLTVRNAAIGGIPSFPYGFCLPHFLGYDANVVSWDYSMNEGKGSTVLEAYIRQSQSQLSNTQPMMIVLDTNAARCQLLDSYIQSNLLLDGLCVGMAKDAVENLQSVLQQDNVPIGFQNWNEFGAAPSCPGRGDWHPKKMEHELIGWMIALYFVDAIQMVKQTIETNPNWKTLYKPHESTIHRVAKQIQFPQPHTATSLPQNDNEVTSLLYGHRNTDDMSDAAASYTMNHVSCRTNFLPATDIDSVLPSIVVNGLNTETTADNIMTERTDPMYETGWVLDVSSVERVTKVKVDQCGGLGYVDMKIALYGIPKSGVLRLWLPIESRDGGTENNNKNDALASNWFNELIICEANEKRAADACRLDTDIAFTVGGSSVVSPKMIHGAGEYLKRQTCVHVGIPEDAKITRLSNVRPSEDTSILPATVLQRLAGTQRYSAEHVGIIVDIEAKSKVSREKGACCISHVVWEETTK
jgi:hypothetical protein